MAKMNKVKACKMCSSAYTDPELNNDNDLSYFSIGKCDERYRMMLRAGADKPVTILLESWNKKIGWLTIGYYQPKYCPNCGRELKENEVI